MEKYVIFSDLHGDRPALELLLDQIDLREISLFVCAGDVGMERVRDLLAPLPLLLVRGNCDFYRPIPPRYTTATFRKRVLFVTHGHIIRGWEEAPYPLSSDDLFISGHTHVAKLIHLPEEPITLNPGSLSSPRDNSPPSYALLSSDEIVIKNLLDGSPLASLSLTKLSQL
jgi:putative phosphoesterase